MTASSPAPIGFIGVGQQGMPIASNLLAEGRSLVVFDVDDRRMAAARARGADTASSPADVASMADRILICVATSEQTRDVVEGPNGLLRTLRSEAIVAVLGTIAPSEILRLSDAVVRAGAELIDAPLSGGAAGAEARSLLFMVGGGDQAVAACRPLLESSSRRIIHAGSVASGVRAKLVHQAMLCGNLLVAREGWSLGMAAGLAPEILTDVIRSGGGQSAAAELLPSLDWDDHVAGLWSKDLGLVAEMATELSVPTPLAGLVGKLMSATNNGARQDQI